MPNEQDLIIELQNEGILGEGDNPEQLIAEMGEVEPPTVISDNQLATPAPQEPVTEPTVEPTVEPTNPEVKVEENVPQEEPIVEEPTVDPRIERLERIAKEQGFEDMDSFISNYETERIKKFAEEEGISVRLATMLMERNQVETANAVETRVNSAVDSVVKEYNLSADQAKEFIQKAADSKFDLTAKETDVRQVYQYLYSDKIIEAQVQAKLEAQYQATQGGGVHVPQGTASPQPTSQDLDAELTRMAQAYLADDLDYI